MLVPYLVLAIGFIQLFTTSLVPVLPMIVLAAVTFAIGAIPPFLPVVRALSISAARNLLNVDLPEPTTDPPWEARLLGAVWYALHLIVGGLTLLAILYAAPMAVLVSARALGDDAGWPETMSLAPFNDVDGPWALAVAIGLLVVLGYVIAGAGALLAKLAPLLLGPTTTELQAALDAQAAEFAERNRLARDLHDSVGHALTVTTLQAAAARRVMSSDPEFAERAMKAVEDTGRAALDDLDHVLGVLRAQADEADEIRPQTLADVEQLVAGMRTAGADIRATSRGELSSVAPAISRAAFRVIQEGLTNAVRHAGQVPVMLHVDVRKAGVDIEITNPLPAGAATGRTDGGRGLRGMRERVHLLHGELSAGVHQGDWQVRARLPAHPPTVTP